MRGLLRSIPSPTKIREELERMVLLDLLGPVGGPEEEVDEQSVRDRYLDVFALIQERDREMADAFNDMRRSQALQRLVGIQSLELLTEEELQRLSPELRESLRAMLEILK